VLVGLPGRRINDAPALHAADVGISVDGAADVARAAADMILLEHDLSVVSDAVIQGRSTVQNVSKYVLMGSSSNFGNMFSMAGAALFLPFLPMLPIQILLNNLLYDVSEIAIPFDHVDPESTALPVKWDVTSIERFMLVFGPVSSIFDFLTSTPCCIVWRRGSAFSNRLVHRVNHHTGPGGLCDPYAAVVLSQQTAWSPSRPGPWGGRHCDHTSISCTGRWFGFVAPPPLFFIYLIGATALYLTLVEITKKVFYRYVHGRQ